MRQVLLLLGLDSFIEKGSAALVALATVFITRYYSKKENEARLRKDNEEADKIRAEKDVMMNNHHLSQRDGLLEDFNKLQKDHDALQNELEEMKSTMKKLIIANKEQAVTISYLKAHQSKY